MELSKMSMYQLYDDVIKWKHFPRYWPFVRGIHRSPVNSPHKGQWRGALMLSLICAWMNGCVNNSAAGDLRRHRSHYDVPVIYNISPKWHLSQASANGKVCASLPRRRLTLWYTVIWRIKLQTVWAVYLLVFVWNSCASLTSYPAFLINKPMYTSSRCSMGMFGESSGIRWTSPIGTR